MKGLRLILNISSVFYSLAFLLFLAGLFGLLYPQKILFFACDKKRNAANALSFCLACGLNFLFIALILDRQIIDKFLPVIMELVFIYISYNYFKSLRTKD